MKLNLIFLVNNYHSEFILVLLPTANKNPSYFTPNHSLLSLSHPHSQTNSFTLSALQFPHQWVSVLSNLNTCFLHSSFHRFPNKHSFRCSSNCQVKTMGKTVVMGKKKKKTKLPQNTEIFLDHQLAMFKGRSHHFFWRRDAWVPWLGA